MLISKNLSDIKKTMTSSAEKAGRNPSDIVLMAVSKTFGAESIRSAYQSGCRVFGENRVQEASEKIVLLSDLGINWHLIGHLQKNKINKAVELFDSIDSVDEILTARKISLKAGELGKRIDICIEVNIGCELQKNGVMPDELLNFAGEVCNLENIKLRGIMAIPPRSPDKEESRTYFRKMKILFDKCITAGMKIDILSMGMSGDFDVAIEEGATMIRIGRLIFGNRADSACCRIP